jgi:flagellar assembly protein FliH
MSDAARPKGAAAAERWSLPAVEGPVVGMRRKEDAEPGSRAWQSEHSRGYEAGMAAGRAEAQGQLAELESRVRRLDAILALIARPLAELDAEVQQQLTLLALTVGKQLVRRELKTDPAQVVAIIREAVGRLPIAARDVRVHLHPEDAAVVRERLATPSQERAWTMVEDPAMTRGGCVVRTDTTQIDARLESRLSALVSAMMGEERAARRQGADGGASE